MCKLPMPWALTHPHTITDAGFWTKRWQVLFLFGPENMTSIISKNYLKCELVRPQHTFPLCVSPCNCTLRNVLKLLGYLFTQLFTKWWTSTHPCLWMSLSGKLFLYPIMTLTCFQLTCSTVECSKQGHVAPVPAFWNMLQASNSKWVNICKKTTKYFVFNLRFTQCPNFIGIGVVLNE